VQGSALLDFALEMMARDLELLPALYANSLPQGARYLLEASVYDNAEFFSEAEVAAGAARLSGFGDIQHVIAVKPNHVVVLS
jgi:hypothetical protein